MRSEGSCPTRGGAPTWPPGTPPPSFSFPPGAAPKQGRSPRGSHFFFAKNQNSPYPRLRNLTHSPAALVMINFLASAARRRHRARAAPSLRRFWRHYPLCQSPPMHCLVTFTLAFSGFSPFFVIFNTRPRCLALSFLALGGSPGRGGFRGSPYAIWATLLRKIH